MVDTLSGGRLLTVMIRMTNSSAILGAGARGEV